MVAAGNPNLLVRTPAFSRSVVPYLVPRASQHSPRRAKVVIQSPVRGYRHRRRQHAQGNFLRIDRLRAPAWAFSNTAADYGIDKNKIGRDFSSGASRIARGWAKSLGSVRAERWSYPITVVACQEWRSPRHWW